MTLSLTPRRIRNSITAMRDAEDGADDKALDHTSKRADSKRGRTNTLSTDSNNGGSTRAHQVEQQVAQSTGNAQTRINTEQSDKWELHSKLSAFCMHSASGEGLMRNGPSSMRWQLDENHSPAEWIFPKEIIDNTRELKEDVQEMYKVGEERRRMYMECWTGPATAKGWWNWIITTGLWPRVMSNKRRGRPQTMKPRLWGFGKEASRMIEKMEERKCHRTAALAGIMSKETARLNQHNTQGHSSGIPTETVESSRSVRKALKDMDTTDAKARATVRELQREDATRLCRDSQGPGIAAGSKVFITLYRSWHAVFRVTRDIWHTPPNGRAWSTLMGCRWTIMSMVYGYLAPGPEQPREVLAFGAAWGRAHGGESDWSKAQTGTKGLIETMKGPSLHETPWAERTAMQRAGLSERARAAILQLTQGEGFNHMDHYLTPHTTVAMREWQHDMQIAMREGVLQEMLEEIEKELERSCPMQGKQTPLVRRVMEQLRGQAGATAETKATRQTSTTASARATMQDAADTDATRRGTNNAERTRRQPDVTWQAWRTDNPKLQEESWGTSHYSENGDEVLMTRQRSDGSWKITGKTSTRTKPRKTQPLGRLSYLQPADPMVDLNKSSQRTMARTDETVWFTPRTGPTRTDEPMQRGKFKRIGNGYEPEEWSRRMVKCWQWQVGGDENCNTCGLGPTDYKSGRVVLGDRNQAWVPALVQDTGGLTGGTTLRTCQDAYSVAQSPDDSNGTCPECTKPIVRGKALRRHEVNWGEDLKDSKTFNCECCGAQTCRAIDMMMESTEMSTTMTAIARRNKIWADKWGELTDKQKQEHTMADLLPAQ